MNRRISAALLVVALLLPGCTKTDDGTETAATAARRHMTYMLTGRYERAWDELNPGQKDLPGGRTKFLDCMAQLPGHGDVSIEATHSDAVRTKIPGIPLGQFPAIAVTLRIVENGAATIQTVREIAGTHWTWFTTDACYLEAP